MFEPNITDVEWLVVQGDRITLDLLIWRRYKVATKGTRLIEVALDMNPHLARAHHLHGPFIPPGTKVKIPIDRNLLAMGPKPLETITLVGKVK